MPTQLKKTVKPSGGDYTSLEACMNANEQNLVTADKYFDVEIDGDWTGAPDTTNVAIHSYTTDATRRIKIYSAVGSHYVLSGAADTSPMITINGGGSGLIIQGLAMNCQGLAKMAISEGAIFGAKYRNLTIYNSAHTTGTIGLSNTSSTSVENCILYTVKRGIYCGAANTNAYARNCTVIGGNTPSYGILRIQAVNCYVGGFATGCYNAMQAASDYLVSSDATGDDVAAHSAINKSSYSSYFVNVGAGTEDYHLKGTSTSLWGLAGTDLGAIFTDDIDGETRP